MRKIIHSFCLWFVVVPVHSLFAQMQINYQEEVGNSVTFNRAVESCDALSGRSSGYSVSNVTVDAQGEYTIFSRQVDFNGILFIYETLFDPADPLANCIAGNDDESDFSHSKIDGITLFPGTNYAVVVAGFDTNDTGQYINTVEGPGNIGLASTVSEDGATEDANRFNRMLETCDQLSPQATKTNFSVQTISVGFSGDYTIAQAQADYDGYIHVYDDRFNPLSPAMGCIAGNDDGPNGAGTSLIPDVRLAAGHTYYVVSSGLNNSDSGAFTTVISGPGDISFIPGTISLAKLSGIWYDPALEGSGFNVVASRTGIIFTFFGYLEGVQRWLISELITSEIRLGQFREVTMFIGEMGELNNPAPGTGLPVFGTMTFFFENCTEATAILRGSGPYNGLEADFSLVLLLQAAGLECD